MIKKERNELEERVGDRIYSFKEKVFEDGERMMGKTEERRGEWRINDTCVEETGKEGDLGEWNGTKKGRGRTSVRTIKKDDGE